MPKRLAMLIVWMAFAAPLAGRAGAQCDYSLTTYASSELDGGGGVSDLVVFDDGNGPALIAGGSELIHALDSSGSDFFNIAKWRPDIGWTPLGALGEISNVGDLEAFEGSLYVTDQWGPQRWTGSEWLPLGTGLIGWARDLVIVEDGSSASPAMYAMTSPVPPSLDSRMMKLSDGAWQPFAVFNHRTTVTQVMGTRVIVAGQFTEVNGVPVNRIAEWDGKQWTDLGAGIGISVGDLIVHEINGAPVLVACGTITLAGASESIDIAYWDGNTWLPLPGIDVDNQYGVGPLAVWDNGDGEGPALCMALGVQSPDTGDSHTTVYRLDPSSQQWEGLGTTFYLPSSYVLALQPYHERNDEFATLYVGGRFSRFGGIESHNLVRVLPHPDSGVEPLPSDPRALRGTITGMAKLEQSGRTTIFAGGHFRGIPDDSSAAVVAKFEGDSWTSIGAAVGSGRVETIQVLDDGTGPALYAAGTFGAISPYVGQPPNRIARWDGVNWNTMGSPVNSIRAICVHDDGSGPAIYSGLFNGMVAKWNAATNAWAPITPGLASTGNFGPNVYALQSFDDGSGPALYVSGTFTSAGGVRTNNIARWRGAAQGWCAVGGGLPSIVRVMHVHDFGSGPQLVAAGSHGSDLRRWDGTNWTSIGDPHSIGLSSVYAITTFDDGSGPALVAGSHAKLARWNASGWAAFAEQNSRTLLAVGDTMYVGSPFAILAPGGDQLAVGAIVGGGAFDPNASPEFHADIVHGGAATYQWRHNGVSLPDADKFYGAHSNRLRIWNVNGSHEGAYDIVVSNDCDTIISKPIMVDVIGTCMGDVDGDDDVDPWDLFSIISAWGVCPLNQPCLADLSHDSAVNVTDLLRVIERWGPCP